MTVDDATLLLTGLIGETTVRDAVDTYSELDDQVLALLVRWVAGERITQPTPVELPARVQQHLAASEHDDMTDRIDLGDVTLL